MNESDASSALITRAYVYAIDPTPDQISALRSHIGGSRYTYNLLLGIVRENWDTNCEKEELGYVLAKDEWIDTSHFGLLYLWAENRDELAPWWSENASSTYNDAAQRLSAGMTNYRKGRSEFPKIKRKGQSGSVRFLAQAVQLTDSHHVRIARVGEVKTYESTRKLFRHLQRGTGRIVAATIAERLGKWKISFTVEMNSAIRETRSTERVIGVGVGITTLYTGATPDGELVLHVENPRGLQRSEKKLAHAQRITSRRRGPKKGVVPSKRWRKANSRVQKIHAGVNNAEATSSMKRHHV